MVVQFNLTFDECKTLHSVIDSLASYMLLLRDQEEKGSDEYCRQSELFRKYRDLCDKMFY